MIKEIEIGEKDLNKKYGLYSLITWAISLILFFFVNLLTKGEYQHARLIFINIVTVVIWWILPFIIVYNIEKDNWFSLGLKIPSKYRLRYLFYALIALMIPAIFVYYDSLFLDFIEQLVFVGLAEEFFYRGYLLSRFTNWLGKWKGLFFSSTLFGLGHFASVMVLSGFRDFLPALSVATQTFVGGLIFGFIAVKAKNIWPGSIIHISVNLYLYKIIGLLL